jgi:hypothetical protein
MTKLSKYRICQDAQDVGEYCLRSRDLDIQLIPVAVSGAKEGGVGNFVALAAGKEIPPQEVAVLHIPQRDSLKD